MRSLIVNGTKIDEIIPCTNPDCRDGKDHWLNPETNKVEIDTCDECSGYGVIDNLDYWANLLPKVIPFKEGQEAYLEAYDLKRYGKQPLKECLREALLIEKPTELENAIEREMFYHQKP